MRRPCRGLPRGSRPLEVTRRSVDDAPAPRRRQLRHLAASCSVALTRGKCGNAWGGNALGEVGSSASTTPTLPPPWLGSGWGWG
eukprot:scaffold102608_cov46-Phaeocystis_antarctica.AAC.3